MTIESPLQAAVSGAAYAAGYGVAEELIDTATSFQAALVSIHRVRDEAMGTPEFWEGVLDAVLDRNEELAS